MIRSVDLLSSRSSRPRAHDRDLVRSSRPSRSSRQRRRSSHRGTERRDAGHSSTTSTASTTSPSCCAPSEPRRLRPRRSPARARGSPWSWQRRLSAARSRRPGRRECRARGTWPRMLVTATARCSSRQRRSDLPSPQVAEVHWQSSDDRPRPQPGAFAEHRPAVGISADVVWCLTRRPIGCPKDTEHVTPAPTSSCGCPPTVPTSSVAAHDHRRPRRPARLHHRRHRGPADRGRRGVRDGARPRPTPGADLVCSFCLGRGSMTRRRSAPRRLDDPSSPTTTASPGRCSTTLATDATADADGRRASRVTLHDDVRRSLTAADGCRALT